MRFANITHVWRLPLLKSNNCSFHDCSRDFLPITEQLLFHLSSPKQPSSVHTPTSFFRTHRPKTYKLPNKQNSDSRKLSPPHKELNFSDLYGPQKLPTWQPADPPHKDTCMCYPRQQSSPLQIHAQLTRRSRRTQIQRQLPLAKTSSLALES